MKQVSKKARRTSEAEAPQMPEARETAMELARRSGLSLGEWLNAMAGDDLEAVQPDGAGPSRQALDGLAEQLTRMSRDASATSASAHPSTTRAMHHLALTEEWFRASEARTAGLVEMLARRSQAAESATADLVATVGQVTRDSEARTLSALDAVKSWIAAADRATQRTGQPDSAGPDQVLVPPSPGPSAPGNLMTGIADRLEAIEQRLPQREDTTAAQLTASIRQLDERLSSLSGEIQAGRRSDPGHGPESDHRPEPVHGPEPILGEAARSARPSRRRPLFAAGSGAPDFREAIEEIQARQGQLSAQPVSEASLLDALRDDIAALARQIERDRPAGGEGGLGARVDELRREVAGLADSIRQIAPAHVIDGLQRRVDELAGKLDEVRTHAGRDGAGGDGAVAVVEARFAEIMAAVEQMRPADITRLESAVQAIARQVDHLSGLEPGADLQAVDALQRQARDIGEAVQRATIQPDALALLGSQITDLNYRLDALSGTQLDGGPRRSGAAPEESRLEILVRQLAERMDRAQRPDADESTLASLEAQVARLAERLDTADLRSGDLGGVEQSLTQLFGHLDETRRELRAAADTAASRAVEGAVDRIRATADPAVESMRRHVEELRQSQDEADRATRDSLHAVQGTLEAVARRLVQLETTAGQRRDGAQPAANPVVQAPTIPAPDVRPEATERKPARMAVPLTDDFPIEPGTSKAPPVAAPLGPATLSAREMAAASASDSRASFIAAARRAAQAAAHEAAQESAAGRSAAPAFGGPGLSDLDALLPEGLAAPVRKAAEGSVLSRLRGAYGRHKRPILLGLAAVVLALGTLQVARTQVPFDKISLADLGLPSLTLDPKSLVADNGAEPSDQSGVSTGAETRTGSLAATSSGSTDAARSTVEQREGSQAAKVVTTAQISLAPTPAGGPAGPSADTLTSAAASSAMPPAVASAPAAPSPALASKADAAAPPVTSTGIPSLGTAMLAAASGEQATGSIDRQPPEGLKAFDQAIKAGDPRALFDKGSAMADRIDDPAILKLAAGFYERAAQKGFAPAAYRLGSLYEKGLGLPRDPIKAKGWYERAADKGNVKAMHNLAVLYAEGAVSGKADYAMASSWFRKAAERGLRDSQYNLAILSARGLGVGADLKDAYRWFAIAAQQGDADAARKRDEVAARLGEGVAAALKPEIVRFQPIESPAMANEGTLPPVAWGGMQGGAKG